MRGSKDPTPPPWGLYIVQWPSPKKGNPIGDIIFWKSNLKPDLMFYPKVFNAKRCLLPKFLHCSHEPFKHLFYPNPIFLVNIGFCYRRDLPNCNPNGQWALLILCFFFPNTNESCVFVGVCPPFPINLSF